VTICSYFGNLFFPEFINHVAEIKAKGFDTILFAITETDILYNLGTFKEFRQYAESEGLNCWATYWGLTAGEAIAVEKDIDKWLNAIWEIGFFHVMIDEPNEPADIWKFIMHSYRFRFHLCLTDDSFCKMSDEEIKAMPVRSLGLSCYHLGHRDWNKVLARTDEWTARLQNLRPFDNFVFIQAFDIPEGMEQLPKVVKEIAISNGIENFGVWSFRATAGTSSKRPANHEHVWKLLNFSKVSF
jgi:hypothetical protein